MSTKAKFLGSCAKSAQFPDIALPEVALVGRSNVGKSSLLNHFAQSKNLAHISSTPGKTQLINFFSLEDFVLVDLPGYGFAKTSHKKKEEWHYLIEEYLTKRKNLKLLLLLCDIRNSPTKDDIAFAKWAFHFGKITLIVFTKTDKLPQNKVEGQVQKHRTTLPTFETVHYSIKDSKARDVLSKKIKGYL